RHSDEQSEEESHCATGCKLTLHKHEKILRYTQNDEKRKRHTAVSQARHSDEQSEEESHCATGCKLTLHKLEKILRYTQNDDIII
ncbi:MAG: hypothetical protein N4A43_04320, partial [Alphaproteobacteria bacterium]|nr:hypothetical protein [Alphaproteobacteria bacterium]